MKDYIYVHHLQSQLFAQHNNMMAAKHSAYVADLAQKCHFTTASTPQLAGSTSWQIKAKFPILQLDSVICCWWVFNAYHQRKHDLFFF